MGPSSTIRILTAKGSDEIELPARRGGKPAVLVGYVDQPGSETVERVAKRERREIARTYSALGFDVYLTLYDPRLRSSTANRRANAWANDLFIQSNGIIIPAKGPFAELGKGGYYVFGEDFVLVSTRIEEAFHRQRREHPGFRRAFAGKQIHFIEPYVMALKVGTRISRIRLGGHIDLTIGYVPGQRVLTVADVHLATVEAKIRSIAARHRLKLVTTAVDPAFRFHPFVNNYFVVSPGRADQVVVANRLEGFDRRLRALGARVRAPRLPITHLSVYRGSIKCVSNQVPSARVLDWLRIRYRPFSPPRIRIADSK